MKVRTKMFIELWYEDGSREIRVCGNQGLFHFMLRSILPPEVFAYQFFLAEEIELNEGNFLRGEPIEAKFTNMYFFNCTLVCAGGLDGVEFFAQNSVGNKYPFHEGDVLILSGRGKNGFVRKVFVRKGDNVDEETVN